MTSRFAIPVPSDFDFRATVLSHGWCNLAPFAWDMDAAVLERPLRVPGRPTVTAAFRQPGGRGAPVEVAVRGGRGARERRAIEEAAVVMLRLGADLSPFYARCRGAGRPFATARRHGFGRLLRSPTLFEDLAKILATTNTTWSGTKSMVVKLIALCATDGAFPSPDEVAAAGTGRVRDEARWGYRAAALVELAEKVAGGGLDLARWESWEDRRRSWRRRSARCADSVPTPPRTSWRSSAGTTSSRWTPCSARSCAGATSPGPARRPPTAA
jgi:hypothetical protein